MRDQILSRWSSRFVLIPTEDDMLTYRVSQSVNRPRRLRRLRIRMNPHIAKIMPKSWLHECASLRVQRVAGRAQHFVDDGWDFAVLSLIGRRSIGFALQFFLAA